MGTNGPPPIRHTAAMPPPPPPVRHKGRERKGTAPQPGIAREQVGTEFSLFSVVAVCAYWIGLGD
jgi:hypothetical protein